MTLGLSALLIGFISCSSSDNDDFISTEDQLVLDGQWQLETMDFQNAEDVAWKDGVLFSGQTAFGYAPYMFAAGDISGFLFGRHEVTAKGDNDEVLGSRFDYVMGGFTPPQFDENTNYWYWNYTKDGASFEIQQVEGPLPPHDYSLYDIRDIKISDEGKTIEFTADLTTRIVGADRGENRKTPVRFKITKGTPSKFVEVYIDGERYTIPNSSEESGN